MVSYSFTRMSNLYHYLKFFKEPQIYVPNLKTLQQFFLNPMFKRTEFPLKTITRKMSDHNSYNILLNFINHIENPIRLNWSAQYRSRTAIRYKKRYDTQ